MSGEMSANRRYNNGTPGFYVVNPRTQIAVAGPLSQAAATREANTRNATPPIALDQLEVVEIVDLAARR